MAWSWSHTPEAYANVKENLFGLDKQALVVIFAEWAAAAGTEEGAATPDFNEAVYTAAVEEARNASEVTLAGKIWIETEALATCDNGGFEAWVCPYGCHTLPFDLLEDCD